MLLRVWIARLALGLGLMLSIEAAWSQPSTPLAPASPTPAAPAPAAATESPIPPPVSPALPAVETPVNAAEKPVAKDSESQTDPPFSSGLYGRIKDVALRRFLVLLTAFLIGVCGAAAFHLGVYTGFIARESRGNLLEFLHVELANRTTITARERRLARVLCCSFWGFGGVVAMVFQMADADSLVPIQAFVLGASWPSVVTQLMSGRSGSSPPPANINPPPPPTGGGGGGGGTASPGEVTI